jgi:hypothetical protein
VDLHFLERGACRLQAEATDLPSFGAHHHRQFTFGGAEWGKTIVLNERDQIADLGSRFWADRIREKK